MILKVSRLIHVCRLSSSWFHLVGPYVLKAVLVDVFLFVVAISSKLCLVFDLRPSLLCSFLMISSCRYFGVCLLSNLNMNMSILKSVLFCIGNQCISLRHFVVLSLTFCLRWFLLQCFFMHCIAFIDFLAGLQVWIYSSLGEIELMIWLMCGMCYCQCISWCFWFVLDIQLLLCICWWCEL